MSNTIHPNIYWSQTKTELFLRIDINDPENIQLDLEDDGMQFFATTNSEDGSPTSYHFSIDFYGSTNKEENEYELVNHQLQFMLKKEIDDPWPRLTVKEDPKFLIYDADKFRWNINDSKEPKDKKKKASKGVRQDLPTASENIHREIFENRDIHNDYPHMYDEVHKEEFGYRREDLKKVYLIIYNLCQFIGFLFIVTILTIRYARDGPDFMPEAYNSCGHVMKFIQLLQFLEVLHPLFGYTKGSPLLPFMQITGRAFILFLMIEAEPRMQTKPVVFYLFFVWSLVEVFRYPYYITQVLNVDIPLLTWLRYTVWIPLYPLGFLFEGTIILRNIPYFEETNKFTVSLPNSWNFAFHFPTTLRIYLLLLCGPAIYTMMSHMHRARNQKLFPPRGRQLLNQKDN